MGKSAEEVNKWVIYPENWVDLGCLAYDNAYIQRLCHNAHTTLVTYPGYCFLGGSHRLISCFCTVPAVCETLSREMPSES